MADDQPQLMADLIAFDECQRSFLLAQRKYQETCRLMKEAETALMKARNRLGAYVKNPVKQRAFHYGPDKIVLVKRQGDSLDVDVEILPAN